MSVWRETEVVVKPRDTRLRDQRNVAVICTGGTLCMKPNAEGALAPEEGFLAERMLAMPEFKRDEMPACTLFELLPLLDSSDMGPDDWVRIAETIERLYYEYDGFVLVIGTDTMAYAASALSFMLESLGKSVILTGSMLPLSVLFNDAHRNLIVSIVIAATLDVPEVCIFMDDQLMRGNRTVKSNSTGLDAFESPNFPALAKLETGIRFRPNLVAPQPKGRFHVHKQMEKNVAVWRMVPGFDDEYIRMAVQHCSGLKAIVLELYGTGNLSARKASLVEALEMAVSKGIVIVATSQCLRGSVNLSTYALGRRLEAIGVLSAFDMTTEAVVTKLAYLLSWPDMSRALVKQYMGRSLRGEVTESLALEGDGHGNGRGHRQPDSHAWLATVGGHGPITSRAGSSYAGDDEQRISLPRAQTVISPVTAAPAAVPVTVMAPAGGSTTLTSTVAPALPVVAGTFSLGPAAAVVHPSVSPVRAPADLAADSGVRSTPMRAGPSHAMPAVHHALSVGTESIQGSPSTAGPTATYGQGVASSTSANAPGSVSRPALTSPLRSSVAATATAAIDSATSLAKAVQALQIAVAGAQNGGNNGVGVGAGQ